MDVIQGVLRTKVYTTIFWPPLVLKAKGDDWSPLEGTLMVQIVSFCTGHKKFQFSLMELLSFQICIFLNIGVVYAVRIESYALSHKAFGFWDSLKNNSVLRGLGHWYPEATPYVVASMSDLPGSIIISLLLVIIGTVSGSLTTLLGFSLIVACPAESLLYNIGQIGSSAFQVGFVVRYVLDFVVALAAWRLGRYISGVWPSKTMPKYNESGNVMQHGGWALCVVLITLFVFVSLWGWAQLIETLKVTAD